MKINNREIPNEEIVSEAISTLVEERGVPEGRREEEKKRIEGVIDERMTDEILSALPTESLAELKKMLEKDEFSEEEFTKLIEDSGIKMESVAQKVLKEFREEYVGPLEEELGEEE